MLLLFLTSCERRGSKRSICRARQYFFHTEGCCLGLWMESPSLQQEREFLGISRITICPFVLLGVFVTAAWVGELDGI